MLVLLVELENNGVVAGVIVRTNSSPTISIVHVILWLDFLTSDHLLHWQYVVHDAAMERDTVVHCISCF